MFFFFFCVLLCVHSRRVERRWASWVWLIWPAANGQPRLEQQGKDWKKAATSISKSTENYKKKTKKQQNITIQDLLSSVIQFLLPGTKLSDEAVFLKGDYWHGLCLFSVYTFCFFLEPLILSCSHWKLCFNWVSTLSMICNQPLQAENAWMTCGVSFWPFLFHCFVLCTPLSSPLSVPSLQVSQYSGFGDLSLGWPWSRKEQEQVCSLQRLCAHLAAQGTKKKRPDTGEWFLCIFSL